MKKKNELVNRWGDPAFVDGQQALLTRIREEKAPLVDADLRGIIIGDDGPLNLYFESLHGRKLIRLDGSFGRFVCPFFDSIVEGSRFERAEFRTCSFSKAIINEGVLEDSVFDACSFNDSVITATSFCRSRFRDRRTLSCEFLRARLESCSFSDVKFVGVAFRACRLVNCSFKGAEFLRCDLRGAKFVGDSPVKEQLSRCIS